jgi:hypothetical protein
MIFLTPKVIRTLTGLLLFGGVVQAAEKVETYPLNDVIKNALAALDDYQSRATQNGPILKIALAEFDFHIVADQEKGATISLLVFTLGAKREKILTSDLDFAYIPQPKPAPPSEERKKYSPLLSALENAVKAIPVTATQDPNPQKQDTSDLKGLCKLTLVLSFNVSTEGSLGITGKYDLVTGSANYDSKRNDVQQVTLTFNAPASCPPKN